MSEVPQLLDRVQRDGAKAAEELLPLVFEEQRKLARAQDGARGAWPTAESLKPGAGDPLSAGQR